MSALQKTVMVIGLTTALLLGGMPAYKAVRARQASNAKPLIAFTSYKLANGLRVVLAPDHTVPVVGLCVSYAVGSVNEHPDQSGLAHLCEHLMSQGSAHVGRDEHQLLVEETGGNYNATTKQDVTSYYETLPANQLALGLFLEADRMGSLEITQSSFENQRGVVKAEKRERHDDQVYVDLQQTVLRLGYTHFGYGHPTIGDNTGLDGATLGQAQAFFQTYYMPNNAVLALTGDFDPATAKTLIEQRFAGISRRVPPPPVETTEAALMRPGQTALTDPYDSLPCYEIAYRVPAMSDPDDAALTLLADILGYGRSSRLGTALVEPEEAITAKASLRDRRGPGLFVIWATLPPRADFGPAATDINAVLERIQMEGVTAAELGKAKDCERNTEILGLYPAQRRACEIAENAIVKGDPEAINRDMVEQERVTTADIQRVARRYLVASHRVSVTVVPYTDARAYSSKQP